MDYKEIECGKVYYYINGWDVLLVNVQYVFPEFDCPAYCGVLFMDGRGICTEVSPNRLYEDKKEALKNLLEMMDNIIEHDKEQLERRIKQRDYLESANFQMRFIGEVLK